MKKNWLQVINTLILSLIIVHLDVIDSMVLMRKTLVLLKSLKATSSMAIFSKKGSIKFITPTSR